jgi:Holliday junction resolvase
MPAMTHVREGGSNYEPEDALDLIVARWGKVLVLEFEVKIDKYRRVKSEF